MTQDIITSAIGILVLTLLLRAPVPARRSPASARSPSPATPTARRSTSAASSSARRSSARTSHDQVVQERQAGDRQERRPGHRAGPALLPDAAVGDRARRTTPPPPRSPTSARTARRDRAGDRRRTSRPTSRSTEALLPGGLTAAKVPVDAADTLGVRDRPRHLGRPTPTSRPTGSPPSATCRWRRSMR